MVNNDHWDVKYKISNCESIDEFRDIDNIVSIHFKSLDGVIFPSSLTLGQNFNQPIDNVIFPQSLTHLTFGSEFNQPIDNVKFPDSLTHLTLDTILINLSIVLNFPIL